MTYCIILVLSDDPSLGKVDKHLFSQETLLELLVQGFTTNREKICGSQESPKDTSEWNGVRRDNLKVIFRIIWPFLALEGSLELKWLPLALEQFSIQKNRLTGTADLTCLPDTLEVLSLFKNRFHGTIDLTQLPGRLRSLFLHQNHFSGKTDFTRLPEALQRLNISDTQLEGEIVHFDGYAPLHNSNVKDRRKQ